MTTQSTPLLTPEVMEVTLSLLEALNCPRAVTVAILLRSGDIGQLLSLRAVPHHYSFAQDYLDAVTATDFLRKFRDFTCHQGDLEATTLEKWWWAERECYKSNKRLDRFLWGSSFDDPIEAGLWRNIQSCRKMIRWLIGDGPSPSFIDEARFGPGATMSDTSRRSTVPDKMSSEPTLTAGALPYIVPWSGTKWGKAIAASGAELQEVRGNTYFTVPKSATTLRACAKEPSLNGFYQLGVGRNLRNRLKRRGIDLVNAQLVHRRVAMESSLNDSFATIDLSSASDCVSTTLVELLMPPRWFDQLNRLRSPMTRVNGKWVRLEKFSSMGNGFTFELETVLFLGIILGLEPTLTPGVDVFVFGDDIIVPKQLGRATVKALNFYGFTVNPEKTFLEGDFRESCGGDFFKGAPVRAFYLEEEPNEPHKLISLANGIRRVATQNSHFLSRWPRFVRVWHRCLDLLPTHVRRCRGPSALGDVVIHDDEARWDVRYPRKWPCTRQVRVWRPARFRRIDLSRFSPDVFLAAALYGVKPEPYRADEASRFIVPREGVLGYNVGWVFYS